jgi:hypothetical protein
MLMSDAGGNTGVQNATLTFDDSAGALVDDAQPPATGSYRPTDYETNDVFPTPAPAGPYGTSLSGFENTSPNGSWLLFVVDDSFGDQGSLNGGWSLSLTTVGTAGSVAARLAQPVLVGGSQFRFTVLGQPGETYVIQSSTDFTHWAPVSTNTMTGSSLTFQEAAGPTQRFYRAVRP